MTKYNPDFASQGIIFNNRSGSYYGRKAIQSGIITEALYAPDENALADTPMTFIEDCEDGLMFLIICAEEHIGLYQKLAADYREILLNYL